MSNKFEEDQVVRWQIEQDRNFRSEMNDSYTNALIENIKFLRALIINFVTISAGIIGFTIPVFGTSKLVKSPILLEFGLMGLLFLIIYSFWYLKDISAKENRGLTEQQKNFNNYLTKHNEARNLFFQTKQEKNFIAWQNVSKNFLSTIKPDPNNNPKDNALDIVFWIFTLSLFFIVTSLFSITGVNIIRLFVVISSIVVYKIISVLVDAPWSIIRKSLLICWVIGILLSIFDSVAIRLGFYQYTLKYLYYGLPIDLYIAASIAYGGGFFLMFWWLKEKHNKYLVPFFLIVPFYGLISDYVGTRVSGTSFWVSKSPYWFLVDFIAWVFGTAIIIILYRKVLNSSRLEAI